jgi:hypothetical protein
MARKAVLSEVKKLSILLGKFDQTEDETILPSANGIDRIIFQARFLRRALKSDPVGLAEIIDATRKSLLANLASRPELASHAAVLAVCESIVSPPFP